MEGRRADPAAGLRGPQPSAAKQRLAEHGRNVLTAKDREPWYWLLLQQFARPSGKTIVVTSALAEEGKAWPKLMVTGYGNRRGIFQKNRPR